MEKFRCSTCGELHDELPLSYGADAPYWYIAEFVLHNNTQYDAADGNA
jgi:hypothetical protein